MKLRQLPISIALLVVVGLAGCIKEDDPDLLPNGKQPITLTATVEGQTVTRTSTRATGNGSWEGGEEVAMQIDGTVKKYTAATSGVLSAASGVTPWYWQNTSDTKSIEAWHPYNSGTKPTAFTVTADQSTTGYQQSDLIYTPATAISYVSPKLTFHHLPVRVVVNLQAGNGVTEAEVQSATVTLVNQALTSGTIDADWSVAQVASGNSTIAPNPLATPSAGSHKTVQALVVPQLTTTAARFIRITIGGQEFIYSTALNLVAGTQYTYTITVSRNGITVTASGAQVWTGTTTDVTSKTFVAGYAPSDLKIGDYYYSDGTSSDGGYREYTDGSKATLPIMPVLTDASGNARTVVGIVIHIRGYSSPTDDCNYGNFNGKPTGYVLSVDETTNKWSTSEPYKGDGSPKDVVCGYTNTTKFGGYNNVVAIPWCTRHTAVPSTSSVLVSNWYMPSIQELKMIKKGLLDKLNTNLTAANGTKIQDSFYFSSGLMGSYGNYVYVYNPVTTIDEAPGYDHCMDEYPYRAMFAFQIIQTP